MTDRVTPGFNNLQRMKSHLPVNPMTHSVPLTRVTGEDGAHVAYLLGKYARSDFRVNGFNSHTFGDSYQPLVVPPGTNWNTVAALVGTPDVPSLAYMMQEARAKCHAEGVDMLTMLAEMDKSVNLVADVHHRTLDRARKVIDAAAKFKRGDADRTWRYMGRAARVADLLALAGSIWLEYRFGWRLLVQDIESLKEIHDSVVNTFDVSYSRGTFKFECDPIDGALSRYATSNSNFYVGKNQGGTGKILRRTEERLRAERTIRVGVMEQFTGNRPYFGDFFVTGYELIPLSWVVDAFTNVGSIIKAWSPMISGRPVHQWMTDEQIYMLRRTAIPQGLVPTWSKGVYTATTHHADVGLRVKTRTPVGLAWPTIDFHPRGPNALKWLDIGSVVASFGRSVTRYAERTILRM
jgi:hypothetical protein